MTKLPIVRKASPRDPSAVALLTESHEYLASKYPPEDNHFLSIDDLCSPAITFWLVSVDTRDLGCVAMANKGDYAEIKSMYVSPAARGKGVGAALLDTLLAEAKAQKLPRLRLETGDDLFAAHRLYERFGFRVCGPFGTYVEGPHSVFMEREI